MIRRARRTLALTGMLTIASCIPDPAPRPPLSAGSATPAPSSVRAVLFLVGDPGDAIPGRSPLLARVGAEVQSWSDSLGEGDVSVAWLGDLVYPVGIRPPGDPAHGEDTLALHAQLRATAPGPPGEDRGRGVFIPGNHDWGNTIGPKGRARLAVMERKIDGWRAVGHDVRMYPTAGRIGPEIVPLTENYRALAIDTQGWLGGSEAERTAAAATLRDLLADSAWTSILLTHHPLRTGGNHGERRLSDPLGLLSRAGAIPQDLPSIAYGRMKADIEGAIAASGRRPLLLASGHDHNLQLFRPPDGSPEAEWLLVAGSGSKLTDVVDASGMVFGGPWPGFGRLFLLSDGGAILQVAATDPSAKSCDQLDRDALNGCIRDGLRAFRTIWSERIR